MLKNKLWWLTPSVFAELYWYWVVGAVFPATALFDSPLPLILVIFCIIAMILMVFKEEEQRRIKRASDYRENKNKEQAEENTERAKKGEALLPLLDFGPLQIRYKSIITDALRDLTKYTITGSLCYCTGKIMYWLFKDLGIFSTALWAYTKILIVLFLLSLLIVLIILLFFWISDKAYEFTTNRSE